VVSFPTIRKDSGKEMLLISLANPVSVLAVETNLINE